MYVTSYDTLVLQQYNNTLCCELQLKIIPVTDLTHLQFSFPFYDLFGTQHCSNHPEGPLGV